uniref:Uncharacterized protein n=1 Tax=Caenorhabditis japonica TaxID=281687 RepID=A0A8R1IQK6_CAEJA
MSSEFVGVGLRDDVPAPIQKRKVDKPAEIPFCAENQKMYEEYCENMWADRPARLQTALFQFCPGYENRCLH